MMYEPRTSSWFSAHAIRRFAFSPEKKRLTVRSPKKWPRPYEMLSPTKAPAAAAAIAITTFRSPAPASTPAVIATVSLGTTGKNASSVAITNTMA